MALWAGIFFVWLACITAKIRPIKQIMIPKYMMLTPLTTLPKIVNVTVDRSGRMMSASPANAGKATRVNINNNSAVLKPFLTLIYGPPLR